MTRPTDRTPPEEITEESPVKESVKEIEVQRFVEGELVSQPISEDEATQIKENFLTTGEFTTSVDLAPKALRRHLRKAEIPDAQKIGNRWYIPEAAEIQIEKPEVPEPPEIEEEVEEVKKIEGEVEILTPIA